MLRLRGTRPAQRTFQESGAPRFSIYFDEFLEIYEASWRLFDDVLPMLEALSNRPLGVITNGTDAQQRAKLERCGIANRFAVVLTSEAAGVGKPDARIFAQAAARLNTAPKRCVHVGDDWTRDVEGRSYRRIPRGLARSPYAR